MLARSPCLAKQPCSELMIVMIVYPSTERSWAVRLAKRGGMIIILKKLRCGPHCPLRAPSVHVHRRFARRAARPHCERPRWLVPARSASLQVVPRTGKEALVSWLVRAAAAGIRGRELGRMTILLVRSDSHHPPEAPWWRNPLELGLSGPSKWTLGTTTKLSTGLFTGSMATLPPSEDCTILRRWGHGHVAGPNAWSVFRSVVRLPIDSSFSFKLRVCRCTGRETKITLMGGIILRKSDLGYGPGMDGQWAYCPMGWKLLHRPRRQWHRGGVGFR